jgi:hypothetical protein
MFSFNSCGHDCGMQEHSPHIIAGQACTYVYPGRHVCRLGRDLVACSAVSVPEAGAWDANRHTYGRLLEQLRYGQLSSILADQFDKIN